MNRKLLIGIVVIVAVVMVAAVLVIMFLNTPPSPLFSVTGKLQHTQSEGGYNVVSWNFTFVYNGENALQNVNIYLNNNDLPIKTVPEVTKGWTYENIWTPEDITANTTITVAWQGGSENYEFQP